VKRIFKKVKGKISRRRRSDTQNVSMVAMASYGLNALPRQFYGSTATSVLQQIDRPLLLIRSRAV
jgi:nucleotide-binding universal stress UspA family protein